MKKQILLLGALFAFGLTNAQAPLEKGDTQLNAGFGISGWGTPVYAGVDYGIAPNITVGAEGSFRSYSQTGFKSSIIGLQANGNYHFNEILEIPSEWDVYAGASTNYYIWNTDSRYESLAEGSGFGIGIQIGARYFFSKTFGINLEGGGGNATSGGKLGITYKF
ncbi:uncharacterized protein DUF3575 [Gelidibacter algens]|uniref:Uncharacterized protein DUF3575 n=1 Tax=Gelidibacter algens TaxID=49280 RepID=A0A1A7QNR3_9FLAO|nr:DUF3575 domain-containing protein [Gelidibacter algens]OBX20978.1 hypothetical protein A9996_18660 [Gelidibacter algens]RAJ25120.1 uncharacterized protein DUF3575 [Gelidibacter algens]